MKKRLIITEDEKQYIKELYGLLNEAPPTPTPTPLPSRIVDSPGEDWEFDKKEPSNGMQYQFDWNTQEATPSNMRMITIDGAYIETQDGNLKFVKTPKVFRILNDTLFIFVPQSEYEYKTAVYFQPSYVSTIVRNENEFKVVINILKSMNKKFNKIILGAHGSPGDLFNPIENSEGYQVIGFETYWIEGLKELVESPSSEVHLVQCYGAEILSIVKDIASLIGVKTYGGKGVSYTDIIFGSRAHTGNYYVCEPKKVTKTDFDSYYFRDKDGTYWRKKDFPDWEIQIKYGEDDKNNWFNLLMTSDIKSYGNLLPSYPPFKTASEANGFRTYIYNFYPDIGKKYNVKKSDSSNSLSDLSKIWNEKVDDSGLLPAPSYAIWGEKGKTIGARYLYYFKREMEEKGKSAFKGVQPIWSSGYESRTGLPKQSEPPKPLGFFNNGINEAIDYDDEFLLEKKYCSVTSQPSYIMKVLGNLKQFIMDTWNTITTGRIEGMNSTRNQVSDEREYYTIPQGDADKYLDNNK